MAVVHITAPDGELLEKKAAITAQDEIKVNVPIPKPQLWWPNGYGGQPLYKVEVALVRSGAFTAEPLDRRTYQVGLRTIELRQQEDQWGRSFVFVVNGVPIFVKGSNWIPANSFPTRISDKHLEETHPLGGRDAPEYVTCLGRRFLRRRTFLRSLRPLWHPGLAGIYLFLQASTRWMPPTS